MANFTQNWVWVPDKDELFVRGHITDYLDNGMCRVAVKNGALELTREVNLDIVQNCNPTKFNKCNDMAELTHLNEPSVIYNLFLRYMDDMIYTYLGLFLVAINPYKKMPIYELKTLHKFHAASDDRLPPHIFAIAENTHRNLIANKRNQLILVTGESGAGKTENTKKVIQYLLLVTALDSEAEIHDKILRANPILESFGNAKTIKNNNSSRFGKFIRIFFDSAGRLSDATIDYYLLEKSRVSHQLANERNYHAFYQFLRGTDALELKEKYNLDPAKEYKYLNNSLAQIPNVDDAQDFKALNDAFGVIGFSKQEVEDIFKCLAIILLLGNFDFSSYKAEQASFTDDSDVASVAKMLGVPATDLTQNLLRPKVKAGREFVQTSRKASDVKSTIDAFAKHLYEKVFAFVISRINANLGNASGDHFIGVLDIAGFEIFDQNSFEQLCINYTNEKLQQFFNHHLFILEQSEYLREDIQWEFIDFGLDLQPTIDLIDTKKPMGVFEILNEQCILPKASEATFMDKLLGTWGGGQSKKFKPNKTKSGFIIDHYAGPVEYSVVNWLQKNTDPVSENLRALMPRSSNPFIRQLFEETESKPKLKTVSAKHKEQLRGLMEQLASTEPHFVRCILPNLEKKPNKFDKELVLNQLRCNGVLEGIRIARAGYPNKMTFDDFFARYSILNSEVVFTRNPKTNCELIIKHIKLDPETYRIGITKLFFKNGILANLEELRDVSLKKIITGFLSVSRGVMARRRFKRKIECIQASQVIARNFQKVHELVVEGKSPWLRLFVALRPMMKDSIKVMDLSDSIRKITEKLKEVEAAKAVLEAENGNLRTQLKSLEDEIISLQTMASEKADSLKKLQHEEASKSAKIEEIGRQLKEIKAVNEKLAREKALLSVSVGELQKESENAAGKVERITAEYDAEKASVVALKKQIDTLKVDMERTAEADLGSLKEELSALKGAKANLEKQLASTIEKNTVAQSSLSEQKTQLELKIKLLESRLGEKQELADAMQRLKLDLARLQGRVEELEVELLKKKEALAESQRNCEEITRKLRNITLSIEELAQLERSLSDERAKLTSLLSQIEESKKQLNSQVRDSATLSTAFQNLKYEAETLQKAKSEYADEVLRLRRQIDGLKEKLADKENVPPKMDDYAGLKLRLNELNAALRREKFENQKLIEEVGVLRQKVHDTFQSPSKKSALRRSVAMGEDLQLQHFEPDEVKNLRLRLQQEEANATRAENYAIELQKKLNKLQMSRGVNTYSDYEGKYLESQKRVEELEKKIAVVLSDQGAPDRLMLRSSSLGMVSSAASGDFARIYGDISKTLKVTREELNASKSEILRLKSLLRESEDELYEVKRANMRTLIGDYESELATLKVNNGTLEKKSEELAVLLHKYRTRSEEYFAKLELAESAVNISRRHEKQSQKELDEKRNEAKLLKEEIRVAETVIRQLRQDKNRMESAVHELKQQLERLALQVALLEERIAYLNEHYGENRATIALHNEEIRTLHQDVKFRLEKETELIKECKRLTVTNEELERIKTEVLAENGELMEENNALKAESADLKHERENLLNEKATHERKLEQTAKTTALLKELLEENARQIDVLNGLLRDLAGHKSRLEAEVASLQDQLKEKSLNLRLVREHAAEVDEEKSAIRQELATVQEKWNTSDSHYKRARTENLVLVEENEKLKLVNEELQRKATALEEKLYSNEQLKYLESHVASLGGEVDQLKHEVYEGELREQALAKQIKSLELDAGGKAAQLKKYNDENFNLQNMVGQYKVQVEFLHQDNAGKDLRIKALERELGER